MEERDKLRRLKRGEESALVWFIDRYAAYVASIVSRVLGAVGSRADVEEVSSDVFFVLWNSAGQVEPGKVKAYLGGVARNKAREHARRNGTALPLEEDALVFSGEDLEHRFAAQEQAEFLRRAILAMPFPEREIFLRHYYYCQPLASIAAEMDINLSTVKTKLRRGREKLKQTLIEGGYHVEK